MMFIEENICRTNAILHRTVAEALYVTIVPTTNFILKMTGFELIDDFQLKLGLCHI